MHGVGTSTAAITIVNALPTGVGAAAGIRISARAEVELHPAGSHGKWDVRIAPESRTPLVVGVLTDALRRFAPGSSGSGALTLRSEIPVAKGLKSSSAVSAAVALAVADATDAEVTVLEIARLSAHASVQAGVSATGAFDDALAGLRGGIVVTDNTKGELLTSIPTDSDWRVALYVPPSTHVPSPRWKVAFEEQSGAGRSAAEAARRGDWTRAMRENTELVERVLGYDYGPLRDELARRGALASGVSGMGPTLAAVAPTARVEDVSAGFPGRPEDRRIVPFSTGMARGAGGAA